jgi:ATP synthase protein I
MFRVVAAQFLTSMAVAAGAWMVGGQRAAVSALLGGLACVVPNGLFALNLAWLQRSRRSHAGEAGRTKGQAAALLVGEFIKVVLTIGLLATIARTVRDVVWPALIVSIIAVLFMQAAALIRR